MFSPTERVVIASLRHDSPVSTDQIVDAIYGSRQDGGPEWARGVVRVLVHRAQAKLRTVGVEIETVGAGRTPRGRRIKPEHRAIVDALLADR